MPSEVGSVDALAGEDPHVLMVLGSESSTALSPNFGSADVCVGEIENVRILGLCRRFVRTTTVVGLAKATENLVERRCFRPGVDWLCRTCCRSLFLRAEESRGAIVSFE